MANNYAFVSNGVLSQYNYNNQGSYSEVTNIAIANVAQSFNVAITANSLTIQNTSASIAITSPTSSQISAGGYQASGYQEYIAIFNGGGSASYQPTTYIDLSGGARVSNTAGNGYTGRILLMNANQGTGYKQCIIDSGGLDTGTNNYNRLWGTAQLNTATAITGFQMYMSSGNISTGTVQVWGWN